jgi:UPF0755 protein
MKHILLFAAVMLGLLITTVAVGILQVNRFMSSPVNVSEGEIEFVIAPGSSFTTVAKRLADQEIIDNATWYRIYARWSGEAGGIHAGEYLIAEGATPKSLFEQFTSGAVRLYSFTIVEGWNHRDLLGALHADEAIAATMSDEDWPALLKKLGAPVAHPEGLFLPETYRFPRGTTDRDLLSQAYDLMQTVLEAEWRERGQSPPVDSPYEALILASIVEKETARADERLTKRDLQTDTPYNTYTRHGLPPTPIAMPGRAAINAVLHPAEGDELYFVATGLDDGSHKFSTTKAEHDAAVAEYLQRLRNKRRQGR